MKEMFVYHIIKVFDNKIDAIEDENVQRIYFYISKDFPLVYFLKEIGNYRLVFERKDSFFRVERIEQEVETDEQE